MKGYLILLVFMLSQQSVTGKASGLGPPVGLVCEYLTNPVGIDKRSPRLAWRLESGAKDQIQTSYQILVSSSLERAKAGKGDIWNSGKVRSNRSVHVQYTGPELKSKSRYYWRVRVWDKKDQPTAYSDVAIWEMGLLDEADWKGKWLAAPRVYDWRTFIKGRRNAGADSDLEPPDAAPQFRKSFGLKKNLARARLYVVGLGYYVAYLNGRRVGDQVLHPAFTRYDKTVLYSTYDVTDLLFEGENVLGVVLGNGWYNMVSRGVHGFDLAPWRSVPEFLSQLELEYEDGSRDLIISDDTWKVAPGPIIFNSVRQGEFYDARRQTTGWNTPQYVDTHWYQPVEIAGPKGRLKAHAMPAIKVMETLKPVSIREPVPGHFVYDFGKNVAGFVQIKVRASAGTELTFKYGEKLSPDGLIDQSEISRGIMDAPFQTDRYIANGQGEEEWHPEFTYHGFQFVEVKGVTEGVILDLRAMVVYTAFESIGAFECSNELFNAIQQSTLASYKGNYHGVPTDCPHREKNAWTADAHLAAEMALYNFNNQPAYIKWLADIADEQRPSGEIPAIVPTSGWGYHWGNGPAWDNALILIPWYLYQYSGDEDVLRDLYPHMSRYVKYLTTRTENNILDIGLGDWAPAKTETPVAVTSTAYFYVDAVIMSEIAKILNRLDDERYFRKLAVEIRDSFRAAFYKGDGVFANGSQTALSTSIYNNLSDDLDETVTALVDVVTANNDHLDVGILGAKYLLHALSDHGHAELAYKIVNQRTFPGWGYWMEQGATTLWEKWDGSMSQNHVMFGDVSAWFYKTLAGIAPDAKYPGFKRIRFAPHFIRDLQWVKATHNSLYGEIYSHWTRSADGISWQIQIPPNTSGEVILPADKKIAVDGVDVLSNQVIKKLSQGDSTLRFVLGSGQYAISIR